MKNPFCKIPLHKCTRKLSAVASNREKADLAIINCKLVNVCTREIQENATIYISCGRIASVCVDEENKGFNALNIIDAKNRYVAPAFLDGHIHVESSCMTLKEFAKCVIPHGTCGIFWDPHEIANVLGYPGIELAIKDASQTPLKTFITTPSCVPSMKELEDAKCEIGVDEIEQSFSQEYVCGLGEMMNYPGTIFSDKSCHDKIDITLKNNLVVTGHYASEDTGAALNAYISSGVTCCHESTKANEVLEKIRRGCYAQMRYGSAFQDLPNLVEAILKNNIDTRFVSIVTDDAHPETLEYEGHLDRALKCAVKCGLDPILALQMVTINTAQSFNLAHELGSISPSKCADIVILDDLENFGVVYTIIDGEEVYNNGKLNINCNKVTYPKFALNTIKIKDPITSHSFKINVPNRISEFATIRAVQVSSGSSITKKIEAKIPVRNGFVESDTNQDLLKFSVFERHNLTGFVGKGFVNGFGLQRGAIASTVAHDSHNLGVLGTNDEDMALAANELVKCGGGMIAIKNGKVLAKVELEIAGLISDSSCVEMSQKTRELSAACKQLGSSLESPFMSMAFISLPCIPHIRISDRGIVDTDNFKIVSLFIEEEV